MTLEEKAEKYARKTKKVDWEGFDVDKEARKEGYIAGATENGVVWHDMRKTPEDLPETLHPVYAKLDSGTYVFAYCVNEIWHGNDDGIILYHGNGECEVTAWTEIPRFEDGE